MHTIDCQKMIDIGSPDALVLAILCDFKGRPEREVLHHLLQQLQQMTADNETQFRECLSMMEILSSNRGLQQILKEEEKMLSQVKQSELPSYQIGLEQGIEQGIEKGIGKGIGQGKGDILSRQICKRFGPLTEAMKSRISAASTQQLDHWADNILDAQILEDVFHEKE